MMLDIKEIKLKKYKINIKMFSMIFNLKTITIYGDLIRFSATTSNDNYALISKLIENIYNISKKDIIISNNLKLIGVFPNRF